MKHLSDIAEAMLSAARSAGADEADAMVLTAQSLSIDVRNGTLQQAERSEGTEIGLRVLVGRRQAVISTSDIRLSGFHDLAERAVAIASDAPEDPFSGLASVDQLALEVDAAALELSDPADDPDPAIFQKHAGEAEQAARGVPEVTQVDSSSAGFSRHRIHLAASNGFHGGYERSGYFTSCVAISGNGTEMERDYDHDSRVFRTDLRSPADIGRIAGERAVARSGARRPETGNYPVLFDERVSSSLIGHLLSAINGVAITRGASWLKDAMEQSVLPGDVTLTHEPLRPRIAGSRPFDAEGLPSRRFDLVKDGILKNWVLDLSAARKLGMASTAQASRSVAAIPQPSAGNVTLAGERPKTRTELLSEMNTGLLVTSLIGSTISPTTGDYSRGASGFWVENGEIQYPVHECTVAGNLRQMLGNVMLADDARQHRSHVVPSLLVERMTLAGK